MQPFVVLSLDGCQESDEAVRMLAESTTVIVVTLEDATCDRESVETVAEKSDILFVLGDK